MPTTTLENPGNSPVMNWIKDHLDYPHEDYCLIFPFAPGTHGYPAFVRNRKKFYVHRFICQIKHGEAPSPDHHIAGDGEKSRLSSAIRPSRVSQEAWLDHLIFGNGYGLGTPYCDGRFYWLSGRLYTFMQGFGAQLHSIQWTHPNAGEERKLFGYRFRPLHSKRYFLWLFRDTIFQIPTPISRVMVSWGRVDLPRDLDEANAALRQMEKEVGRWP